MRNGDGLGEEVGDQSEPVVMDKAEGRVYALVPSRDRGMGIM